MARASRCLRAAQDLCKQLEPVAACSSLEAVLFQRIPSSVLCPITGGSSSSSSFSTLASTQQQQQQQHSSWPALLQQGHHRHCHHLDYQQNQQQRQQVLSSGWSLLPRATSLVMSRSYARAAPGLRRRQGGGSSSSSMQRSSQQQQQRWPGSQQLVGPLGPSHYQLGRVADMCVPTEKMREPYMASSYDTWQDRDPLTVYPLQVDGTRTDDIEEPMLLRQQLENSALPNAVKRSHFMSPAWEEVLLDVRRTVKVTKGGKVETLHALVVVGNRDGVIGVGQHSGSNIQKVTLDAQLKAYKNLVVIPRYRGHTLYHPIDLKIRKVRLQAWPRQLGFGITASPVITELCDLAGIDNVTVKLSGRRKNIRNVVAVFIEALTSQSLPHDGVEGSGVYVREVYPWKKLPTGLRRGVDVP